MRPNNRFFFVSLSAGLPETVLPVHLLRRPLRSGGSRSAAARAEPQRDPSVSQPDLHDHLGAHEPNYHLLLHLGQPNSGLHWLHRAVYGSQLVRLSPFPSPPPPPCPCPCLAPVSDNTIDCISRSLARYGFEGTAFIPQGLWVRGYRSLLDQVKALGFNLLRLPFSGQMLLDSSVASGINGAANPDLVGLTPLQCMDKIVAYGGLIGLRVLLVRASSKVGVGVSADSALATLTHSLAPFAVASQANNLYNENLWYIVGDSYYTAERFVQDWVMLARRYQGTAVIGADLWEQPRGLATWASGNRSTDWNVFAATAGKSRSTRSSLVAANFVALDRQCHSGGEPRLAGGGGGRGLGLQPVRSAEGGRAAEQEEQVSSDRVASYCPRLPSPCVSLQAGLRRGAVQQQRRLGHCHRLPQQPSGQLERGLRVHRAQPDRARNSGRVRDEVCVYPDSAAAG